MRSRIYLFTALFFALALFTVLPAKADQPSNHNNHSDQHNDRDKHGRDNNSDKNLPINTSIVALLVAGAGIGVMAIKRSGTAKAL